MRDIKSKFKEFHRTNPQIYRILVDLAREAKNAGKTKIGIAMLWEVMRWNIFITTNGKEKYKLNNDYKAFYARLIMEQENDLNGIFELRKASHAEQIVKGIIK